MIDRRALPGLAVTKASPTVVSWDVASGPATYDVIRGDVASLSLSGGTVDLGAVVCVENDSPDAHTLGNQDPDTPSPGQAFFYVTRGSAGRSAGPGSYGTGSGGGERTPSGGGCP